MVPVFSQVSVLLFLMAIGFLSFKLKITTKEASEYFSSFAMKITLPCMTLNSFRRPFSTELLGEAAASIVMSCTVFGVCLLICWIYPRLLKIKGPERGVHRYAILISNSGFVGYPLVEAIMGPSYLFHAVIFNMPGSFLAFSIGAWFVAKERGKTTALSWKLFITPPFVATVVGFFMFLFSLHLPAPLALAVKMAGDITIPLSMMVIGISLAQAKIKQMLGSWRIYVTVFARLLLIPALIGLICYFIGFKTSILMLAVILSATPVGSSTSILASVYNVATEEAGSLVALSTMLCAITIPLIVIVLHQLIG